MGDNKIPKSGRFRPRDRFSYFSQSVRSIYRNKRRSVSMIAGLILGVSILSGIMLYSNVLMSNVYTSIIEGSPYEIRMDFKVAVTDTQIDDFRQEFLDDPKILDAQILYGNGRTVTETTGIGTTTYTKGYLSSMILVEYNNESHSGGQGKIFSKEFYNSEIGNNIRDQLTTGNNPGIYTPNSSYYHGIFISESTAIGAKLQQGNVLSTITLLIEIEDPDDPAYPFNDKEVAGQITLENVTIAGILSSDTDASAGLFSEAIEGVPGVSSGELFLPEELLNDTIHGGNQTSFLTKLSENEMRFCALKIDESKFNLADPTAVNAEINNLIFEYQYDNLATLVGTNLVQGQLLPFQIMSFFIYIFDAILTIPVAVLSLYLLSFGIDLSLHERRYQVGILKTQGASPKQIKRKVLMEALLLAAIGLVVGYIIAVFGAWIIGTASGFMKWSSTAIDELPDFLRLLSPFNLDYNAFFVIGGFIVLILIILVNGKSNTFIEMEITETVRRVDEMEKGSFLKRNHLDIAFFIIGLVTLILVILADSGISIPLGPMGAILAIIGPFLFWIGGASVVARIIGYIPSKTDPLIKRIGFLKDVSILIKGNIFRKSGDIPRLSLIIALTVSFSILAAVQGRTGEFHQERLITFDVGSDMVVSTTSNFSTTPIAEIKASAPDIEVVMAVSQTLGSFIGDRASVYSVDAEVFESVGIWQSDAITKGGSKTELLSSLANDPTGCLLGRGIFEKLPDKSLLQKIPIDILSYSWDLNITGVDLGDPQAISNLSLTTYDYITHNLTVLGVFDHFPGGIGSNAIVVNHELINSLTNFTELAEFTELPIFNLPMLSGILNTLFPPFLTHLAGSASDNPKEILASKYLVKFRDNATIDESALATNLLNFDWITSVKTLKGEMQKANELQNMDFGIPGLLTADFLVSLLAATLATFIFMSILMEKRKKEFAVLRSFGASQGQVYKIVFSETIVILLTAVIWGLFVGLGLSILFNPFFDTINIFVTPLSALTTGGASIKRILTFDLFGLIIT
ncbi:MAG: FtsX-like permease family protein, partial [Candidatus Hodarchaeales archaeon]